MASEKPLKVIDLFAGAGGFGLGFTLAGHQVTCSVEIDKWAADTLEENNQEMRVVREDIRLFRTADEILEAVGDIPDVIIGGPPCQGYTIAGPPKKDPNDPRNSLFQDFARWVECLRPTVFIMENVPGILSRRSEDGRRVIDIIVEALAHPDYRIELWKLNAANYGVPQMRERVFVVGNRAGVHTMGVPPRTHYVPSPQEDNLRRNMLENCHGMSPANTLWHAISDLPKLEAGEGEEEQSYSTEPRGEYQRWARGDHEVLYNHVAMRHTERLVNRFKHIGWNQSGIDVPKDMSARKRNGQGQLSDAPYRSNNRRMHPHKPSPTIPASFYSSFIHPFQHRNLTAREAARIQSFPDEYCFMGKRTVVSRKLLERQGRLKERHLSQYNQIGNAVPPLLIKSIAVHIVKVLSARSQAIGDQLSSG